MPESYIEKLDALEAKIECLDRQIAKIEMQDRRDVDFVDFGDLGLLMLKYDNLYERFVPESSKNRSICDYLINTRSKGYPKPLAGNSMNSLFYCIVDHFCSDGSEVTVIDVGCHAGSFGLRIANHLRHSGHRGRVVLFDIGCIRDLVPKNISVNGLEDIAKFENLAVSNVSGPIIVYHVPGHSDADNIIDQYSGQDRRSFVADSVRLSEYIESRGLGGNLIVKLDTEGLEIPIIRDISHILKQQKTAVIFEFAPSRPSSEASPAFLEEMLSDFLLFDIFYAIHPTQLVEINSENLSKFIDSAQRFTYGYTDILCLPKKLDKLNLLLAKLRSLKPLPNVYQLAECEYNGSCCSPIEELKHPDDPESLEAIIAYGDNLLQIKDTTGAQREFMKASVLAPDYAPAHLRLAKVLMQNGRMPAAEHAAMMALNIEGNNPATLELLASIKRQKDNEGTKFAACEDKSTPLESNCDEQGHSSRNSPTVLPGSQYQNYLMPLDYMPSRDFRPRWGYARPRHPQLTDLFSRYLRDYEAIFQEMRTLAPFYSAINPQFTHEALPEPGWVGGPITSLDLALLYYFIWKLRPENYLEIGSGTTTCFARRSIDDHKLNTKIISIDPDPRAEIDSICDSVIRCGLESLDDLAIFKKLKPGDIVFLDGSHRSFMNSDVTVFMLDILPALNPGVIVHFHDVFLPYDYPDFFKDWYWNEQYILGAYLIAAKSRIKILMPSNFAAIELKSQLTPLVVKGIDPDTFFYGGSLWFSHCAE